MFSSWLQFKSVSMDYKENAHLIAIVASCTVYNSCYKLTYAFLRNPSAEMINGNMNMSVCLWYHWYDSEYERLN